MSIRTLDQTDIVHPIPYIFHLILNDLLYDSMSSLHHSKFNIFCTWFNLMGPLPCTYSSNHIIQYIKFSMESYLQYHRHFNFLFFRLVYMQVDVEKWHVHTWYTRAKYRQIFLRTLIIKLRTIYILQTINIIKAFIIIMIVPKLNTKIKYDMVQSLGEEKPYFGLDLILPILSTS